jgi:uncharacterized protein YndB with AHSA1/START domain
MKIIKKEIVINAPVAKVWDHITDPRKIAVWLMPNDFEPTVGKRFFLECHDGGKMSCQVREIMAPQKLVYSFQSAEIKVETLVTITLTREKQGTRLTLIHSGWDALPPGEQNIADNFDGGWGSFLEKMRDQLDAKK